MCMLQVVKGSIRWFKSRRCNPPAKIYWAFKKGGHYVMRFLVGAMYSIFHLCSLKRSD